MRKTTNQKFLMFVSAMLSASVLLATPVMAAEPILTFGFTDLDGDFNAGNSTFTANACDLAPFGPFDTAGNVERIMPPDAGLADFGVGFTAESPANFNLWMELSNITATTADAAGNFTITDYDGDTITGDITGTWSRFGVFSFFGGGLSNVYFNNIENDMFDGIDGSSFSTDFSSIGTEPFGGAMTLLRTGAWFGYGSVDDSNTLVQGVIIPEPAVVLLLILGGAFRLSWRRRTKTRS